MSTRFRFTDAVFFMPLLFFKRPLAGLWVAVWAFMPFVILFGGMFVLGLQDLLPETAPDGSVESIPSIPVLAVFYAGVIFALIALLSIWLRFLVRDESGGLWPIGLGGDELRLVVTLLIVYVIFSAAVLLAFSPLMFLAFLAGAAGTDASDAMPGLLAFIAVPLAVGVFVWVSVRLSPVFAWSIQQRRIVGLSVWNVSKGVFWPFLGALLVSSIIGTVLQLAGVLPIFPIMTLAGLDGTAVAPEEMSTAGTIAIFAYVMLLFSILMGYSLGPFAYVVRWHAGTLPVEMRHEEPDAYRAPVDQPDTASKNPTADGLQSDTEGGGGGGD